MSIYAINHSPTPEDPHYTDHVRYQIRHEHVGGLLVPALDTVLAIPPRDLWEWHLIHLCVNEARADRPWETRDPWLAVTKTRERPDAVHSRVIGAWCTQYDAPALAYQIQTDRLVQFHADYPYDEDFNHPRSTDGVYTFRGARGCWPSGYAAAVYLRLEVERHPDHADAGFGIGQINVLAGNHIIEGGTHDGSMAFRAQLKGLTRAGQTEAYADMVRLPIPPGPHDGLLTVQVSRWARGTYTASGFELLPT